MNATILALLGLIFTVMSALLAFVIKITINWATIQVELRTLIGQMEALVNSKEAEHRAINERLMYLERMRRGGK